MLRDFVLPNGERLRPLSIAGISVHQHLREPSLYHVLVELHGEPPRDVRKRMSYDEAQALRNELLRQLENLRKDITAYEQGYATGFRDGYAQGERADTINPGGPSAIRNPRDSERDFCREIIEHLSSLVRKASETENMISSYADQRTLSIVRSRLDTLSEIVTFIESMTPRRVSPDPPSQVEEFNQNLFKPLEELGISTRAANALKLENLFYIGDVVQNTEANLLSIPKFGRKLLDEIKEALGHMGLHLGMDIPNWPPDDVEEIARRLYPPPIR